MIPGLDGLRAFAFILVLGSHTDNVLFGWVGVQLFFVLSGFLITGILLHMKDMLSKKNYFIKFYGRRFLRIFPLYYLYLFITLAIYYLAPRIHFKPLIIEFSEKFRIQIWYAVFYAYDFFQASVKFEHSRFFTHLWSLSVEEQFYIVWPLIIYLTPREKLKKLFIFIIALGPLIRIAIHFVFASHQFPILISIPEMGVYTLPFSHMDAFAMGAYFSQVEITRPRLKIAAVFILVPFLGYLSQMLATGRVEIASLGQEFLLSTGYKDIWGYTLLNYLFGLAIYNVAKKGMFNRLLESPPLKYLGRISYGLYIYHTAVIWFILKLNILDAGSVDIYLLAFAITTVIATASFYLFEKPINDLKDRFFAIT